MPRSQSHDVIFATARFKQIQHVLLYAPVLPQTMSRSVCPGSFCVPSSRAAMRLCQFWGSQSDWYHTMIWYWTLETCSCQLFRDRLALPKSLSRTSEFLSVLALCYLCALPSGSAPPIVAFLCPRIETKTGRGNGIECCVHQPEGLPSPLGALLRLAIVYFARL